MPDVSWKGSTPRILSTLNNFPLKKNFICDGELKGRKWKQAGAELCQAQVKLEFVVEMGAEIEVCHY